MAFQPINFIKKLTSLGPSTFNEMQARIKTELDNHDTQLADIPNQIFITEKAKTTDVNNALALKADQTSLNTTNTNVTTLQTQVTSMGSGSPKGTYATLSALQTAYPTGVTGTYVVTADGNWYYWNGSAWTVGGAYQAVKIATSSVDNGHLKEKATSLRRLTQDVQDSIGWDWLTLDTALANMQQGFYNYNTGAWVNNAAYYTKIIDCTSNILSYTGIVNGTSHAGVVYLDMNNNMIGSDIKGGSTVVDKQGFTVTIPNGVAKIAVSFANIGSRTPKLLTQQAANIQNKLKSPLYGKKWVVIGDSNTADNTISSSKYHKLIADNTGCIITNLAYGGTGYATAYNGNEAYYGSRINSIPTDADIITIAGGCNDFKLDGLPLGDVTDTGTTTLCGCVNTTIANIIAKAPNAQIGILTQTPIGNSPKSTWTNNQGYSLTDYINKLIEIAKLNSIPVKDLYHESGLRPWDTTFAQTYYNYDTVNHVQLDLTHLSTAGHKYIYYPVLRFTEKLCKLA